MLNSALDVILFKLRIKILNTLKLCSSTHIEVKYQILPSITLSQLVLKNAEKGQVTQASILQYREAHCSMFPSDSSPLPPPSLPPSPPPSPPLPSLLLLLLLVPPLLELSPPLAAGAGGAAVGAAVVPADRGGEGRLPALACCPSVRRIWDRSRLPRGPSGASGGPKALLLLRAGADAPPAADEGSRLFGQNEGNTPRAEQVKLQLSWKLADKCPALKRALLLTR